MEKTNFFKSKIVLVVVVCLVELLLLSLVFRAGIMVGFHKASYSYQWGEQYQNMFGGPRGGWFGQKRGGMMGGAFLPGGPMGQFDKDDFISPHGIVGEVLSIQTSTVMVKDIRNTEMSLIVTPNTTIRRGNETIGMSDLKVNDRVVVIGAPSSTGQTEVKFMRVFQP